MQRANYTENPILLGLNMSLYLLKNIGNTLAVTYWLNLGAEGVLGEVLVLIFLGDFLEKNGDVSEVFEVFENPCEGEAPFQLQNPFAGVKLFVASKLSVLKRLSFFFFSVV